MLFSSIFHFFFYLLAVSCWLDMVVGPPFTLNISLNFTLLHFGIFICEKAKVIQCIKPVGIWNLQYWADVLVLLILVCQLRSLCSINYTSDYLFVVELASNLYQARYRCLVDASCFNEISNQICNPYVGHWSYCFLGWYILLSVIFVFVIVVYSHTIPSPWKMCTIWWVVLLQVRNRLYPISYGVYLYLLWEFLFCIFIYLGLCNW